MGLPAQDDDLSVFREIALQAGVPPEAMSADPKPTTVTPAIAGQVVASGEGDDHALDTLFDGWSND